jgi:hypothetical protein
MVVPLIELTPLSVLILLFIITNYLYLFSWIMDEFWPFAGSLLGYLFFDGVGFPFVCLYKIILFISWGSLGKAITRI